MSAADEGQGFTFIPNPYITGNPVRRREVFFGREEDFAYVRQRLQAEQDGIVMLFVGSRRSGKTSVMFQILDGRLGEGFLPVFVDMQALAGVANDRELCGRLADLVLDGVKDERLVRDYYNFDEGNPLIVLDRLLGDTQQIFADRRLIILVDEAEILLTKVDQGEVNPAVLTYLASILESRKVSFCFTGSRGLGEWQTPEWRRLLGKGDYREISFLSREDTLRLVQQPVTGQVTYGEGVVDAIYRLTYGQPFYTQLICTYVVDYLNSVQRHRLELDDLAEVVRTIVDNPPPQLIYEWDGFSRVEQLSLSLLSEESAEPWQSVRCEELIAAISTHGYPLDLTQEALHIALEGLYEKKCLERDQAGAYYVRMDLLRQWIRRARSIWRLVEEQQAQPGRRRWLLVAGAVVVVVVVGLFLLLQMREREIVQIRQEQVAAVIQTGAIWVDADRRDVEVVVRDLAGRAPPKTYRSAPQRVSLLQPAEYVVEVRHPDFHPWADTVTVAAGREDTAWARLERMTGFLTLKALAGTKVALEGPVSKVVTAPLERLELPTGEYRLVGTKEGHQEVTRRVAIGHDQEVTEDLALVAAVGHLFFTSTPLGASIALDDQSLSEVTPYLLREVRVGSHRVRLSLADHAPHDAAVTVYLGRTDTVRGTLPALPATLVLKTSPDGAAIFLDSEPHPVGHTPQTLNLQPGRHRVRLELAGYEPEMLDQEFAAGQPVDGYRQMRQQFGTLKINWPLSGIVVVDGSESRFPPMERPLSVGTHQIVLKGRIDTTTVEVAKDQTCSVTLKEKPK